MLANGFGGAERHFVDLSLALAELGYEVQAICHAKFPKQNELKAHPNISVQNVNAFAVWDPFARAAVRRLIAAFQPAIIHSHLARGAFIGGKAAKALDIPAVVNLHNYIDLKYYHNISAFIAATEDQKKHLLAHHIAPNQVTVMPHFSMLPPVAVKPYPKDRPLTFVTLGRMVKKKGFDVLLQAFKRYLDAGKDGRLIIGGDGVERGALAHLAAKLGITDKVNFSGWVEGVASFLAQGDVFVLPSLDEPFGIVVLEAMASGKPIISTRTQGPITVLGDSSAFFAEIGDVETLASAMLAANSKPAVAMQKAQVALEHYQSTYSKRAVVPKVETIYQQLAS
jgi:glycosyltransferase involved in cell wall biosynthesis